MITRRSFLGACMAAAAAPMIVRAQSLMPVRQIWTPPRFGTTESFRFIKSPPSVVTESGPMVYIYDSQGSLVQGFPLSIDLLEGGGVRLNNDNMHFTADRDMVITKATVEVPALKLRRDLYVPSSHLYVGDTFTVSAPPEGILRIT